MQKDDERFFVEEAAKRLGRAWDLQPREHPDFLVADGAHQFGLEVTEVFAGPSGTGGADRKKAESHSQRAIGDLQNEYERTAAIPLRVQIVGDLCAANLAKVVPALVAVDFASKPITHQVECELADGFRVYATKALRAEWFNVNDRVGWADQNPLPRIVEAIERKARKLPRYREAVGADIRLLLVANRFFNSGKLILKEAAALNTQGFETVYFFSYPECVITLKESAM